MTDGRPVVFQEAGEFVVLNAAAYHSGFNQVHPTSSLCVLSNYIALGAN